MGRSGFNLSPGRLALLVPALALILWTILASPLPVPLVVTDRSDMVPVPGGTFTALGRSFEVEAFWIDRFEVREGEWAEYVAETGALRPFTRLSRRQDRDLPLRFVTAKEAEGFAAHRLKRLPTNLEWERAAQGPGGSALPWGEAYLAAANTQEAWVGRGYRGWGVTRVGTFERGRSEAGCYDMIGNVWEWTASGWDEALRLRLNGDVIPEPSRSMRGTPLVPQDSNRPFPWQWTKEDWWTLNWLLVRGLTPIENLDRPERPTRLKPELSYRGMRLIRGGSFKSPIRGSDPEIEQLVQAESRAWDIGFRCVVSDDEIKFQENLRAAVRDLGWRDPLHFLFATVPAKRKIRDLGPRALPYLVRTRAKTTDETVGARLDDLIATIGTQR